MRDRWRKLNTISQCFIVRRFPTSKILFFQAAYPCTLYRYFPISSLRAKNCCCFVLQPLSRVNISLARDRNSDKVNSPLSVAASGSGAPTHDVATLAYERPHPGGFTCWFFDAPTEGTVDLKVVGGELDTTFFFSSAWMYFFRAEHPRKLAVWFPPQLAHFTLALSCWALCSPNSAFRGREHPFVRWDSPHLTQLGGRLQFLDPWPNFWHRWHWAASVGRLVKYRQVHQNRPQT